MGREVPHFMGVALLIMPTGGGGYANGRPCIYGHGGSRGVDVHNSRVR